MLNVYWEKELCDEKESAFLSFRISICSGFLSHYDKIFYIILHTCHPLLSPNHWAIDFPQKITSWPLILSCSFTFPIFIHSSSQAILIKYFLLLARDMKDPQNSEEKESKMRKLVGEKGRSHTIWGGEWVLRASMITTSMGWGQDRSNLAHYYSDNAAHPLIKKDIMFSL